ncbi:hypothetical protein [Helicobacter pylori]|uniref:hypothetical protein n=1 Tax=Helicobacter pylori TaxID=210 RepID=UPI002AC74C68|nr:hypothetical protein [Helicobacter pylori]MDZ5288575.1 hypothetical protein [Helicobacter pylori]
MKVVNLSQSPLTLPTGEVVGKGETVEVKSLDEKHHVVAAWLEAGLIEKLATRTSKTEPTDKA